MQLPGQNAPDTGTAVIAILNVMIVMTVIDTAE